MTTGEKIRAARKARGWTQTELGEKLGVTAQAVNMIENETRGKARVSTMQRCADALGVDWKKLLPDSEPPKKITKPDTMTDIEQLIGTPAVLEQLAEECAELGQAALKLARKMRGENPTPKAYEDLWDALTEETADVLCCIEQTDLLSMDEIELIKAQKADRWRRRIEGKTDD
jgi:transcriptional regulator with XRE-family HTH domain